MELTLSVFVIGHPFAYFSVCYFEFALHASPASCPHFLSCLPSTPQNPVQKLVALRDVRPSDDAAMELRKGEIIYVASR